MGRTVGACTIATLVAIAACAGFDAEPATPSTSADAAAPDASTGTPEASPSPPVDGASPGATETCAPLFTEPFDDNALPGWAASAPAGGLGIGKVSDFAGKPSPVFALGAHMTMTPGAQVHGFIFRSAAKPNVSSAKLEVDVAYVAIDSFTAFGCTLGLTASTTIMEARVGMQLGNTGVKAASLLLANHAEDATPTATDEMMLGEPRRWAHLVAEIAIGADGRLTPSLTLDNVVHPLPSLELAGVDSVRVTCGITHAYAGKGVATASEVYLDDLRVTACMRP